MTNRIPAELMELPVQDKGIAACLRDPDLLHEYYGLHGVPRREEVIKLWDWAEKRRVPKRVVVIDIGYREPHEPEDSAFYHSIPQGMAANAGHADRYEVRNMVRELLKREGPMTSGEIAQALGRTSNSVWSALRRDKALTSRKVVRNGRATKEWSYDEEA